MMMNHCRRCCCCDDCFDWDHLFEAVAVVFAAAAVDYCQNSPVDDTAMFVPRHDRRRDDRGRASGGGSWLLGPFLLVFC